MLWTIWDWFHRREIWSWIGKDLAMCQVQLKSSTLWWSTTQIHRTSLWTSPPAILSHFGPLKSESWMKLRLVSAWCSNFLSLGAMRQGWEGQIQPSIRFLSVSQLDIRQKLMYLAVEHYYDAFIAPDVTLISEQLTVERVDMQPFSVQISFPVS